MKPIKNVHVKVHITITKAGDNYNTDTMLEEKREVGGEFDDPRGIRAAMVEAIQICREQATNRLNDMQEKHQAALEAENDKGK